MVLHRIIISLVTAFCGVFMSAQSASAVTNENLGWDSSSVQYLLDHKEEFKYNSASFLYQAMKEHHMEVKHISSWGTSPWTDPNGKSYMTDIYLYSRVLPELKKGNKYYKLTIVIYTDKDEGWLVEDGELWKSLDDKKPWIEDFLNKTETAIIEDIKVEEKTMVFDMPTPEDD